ncbi:hypothetical protein BDF20DRAFT_913099 [Mycotypha africana]|uniref:uncharacterized protein n=1 Tax=Mycotypha africana TaxID=64632 RepID=UPI002301B7CA|nr:uncharacterized protein BDF20DRAFT_913099 [Mycotypha africana]KAI8979537.1 hypothetical protein BDF20DRAFT_913099 [Mycotypha africana]
MEHPYYAFLQQPNVKQSSLVMHSPSRQKSYSLNNNAAIYQLFYHRSPSLSYSMSTSTASTTAGSVHGSLDSIHNKRLRKVSSPSSTSTTSLSSLSTASRPPPYFLKQSLSSTNASVLSFSSSDNASFLSTSCRSCEEEVAGNICPPLRSTRTTQKIAFYY